MSVQKEETGLVTTEFSKAEVEETFTIRGIIHPVTKLEITMTEAINNGIINPNEGNYIDLTTNERIPIPMAMAQGLIVAESSKKTKSENRFSVGLITVTVTRESRSYKILAVVDPRSEQKFSLDEAVEKGIYDKENKVYHNPATKEKMDLMDAVDVGGVIVEFSEEEKGKIPDVIIKTYSVYAVLDLKAAERISFHEAVQRGILDAENEIYINNLTNQQLALADAMKLGYIKASPASDDEPSSFDLAGKSYADSEEFFSANSEPNSTIVTEEVAETLPLETIDLNTEKTNTEEPKPTDTKVQKKGVTFGGLFSCCGLIKKKFGTTS